MINMLPRKIFTLRSDFTQTLKPAFFQSSTSIVMCQFQQHQATRFITNVKGDGKKGKGLKKQENIAEINQYIDLLDPTNPNSPFNPIHPWNHLPKKTSKPEKHTEVAVNVEGSQSKFVKRK